LIRYFDASALAKRYVAEPHSKAVARLISDETAITGRLSEPEVASALARRHREGKLSLTERDRLLEAMQQDMASLYVAEISPEVSSLACRLLMRHKLRAGDSLHLASALILASRTNLTVQFVGFDEALNEAARQEGLELPVL
jgi:predicted nucleic acid-binding protein